MDSIDDLENLLEMIMREAEAAVGAEAACIALYDPSDELLHIKFASGEKSEEVIGVNLALGQGILGEAASTNMTVRVDAVQEDARFDPSVDQKTQFSTRSILAAPIKRRDTLLGVLEIINKRGELVFSDSDARLLEIVASQAAIAIENARLLERTLQSDRLSAVGKMASSIVHDFKSPLTIIMGYADLLGNSDTSHEKRQRYSKLITEEARGFLSSAQGLLEFARGELRLKLEEIPLDEWLEGIADLLRDSLATAGITLVTEFGFKGKVSIDVEKMRRVVLNMADNARDAMPEGGVFTIATARVGRNWQLSLSDTGNGIPPDQRSKIFDLFATFGKRNGTGLGLAIVGDIVEGHGGAVAVESAVLGENGSESSGTTFYITAPVKLPAKRKKPD